jgi:hypothetical protein
MQEPAYTTEKPCGACKAIWTGYGHVYYGLFAVFALLAILPFMAKHKWVTVLSVVGMLTIAGVTVDLVAHNYEH